MLNYQFEIEKNFGDNPDSSVLTTFHEMESRYHLRRLHDSVNFFVELAKATLICGLIAIAGLIPALTVIGVVVSVVILAIVAIVYLVLLIVIITGYNTDKNSTDASEKGEFQKQAANLKKRSIPRNVNNSSIWE